MTGDDTISRQAAIDVVKGIDSGFVKYIEQLPSAQPEIIKCRECTHHKDELPGMVYCPIIVGGWVGEDCFCWNAERRTDG